jgi:phosphoribosylanthranilate isomerase
MIFHSPSRRNISVAAARQIVAAVGPFVTPVGVFVNASPTQIAETVETAGLQVVQLHGHETPDHVAQLKSLGIRVLKAVRVDAAFEIQLETWRSAMSRYSDVLVGLVLETAGPQPGGTGVPNDWDAVKRHTEAGRFVGLPRLIAAGGLTPQTVAGVVRSIRPWAVDVSSGVESAPGIKSAELIADFVSQVRAADDALDAESGVMGR